MSHKSFIQRFTIGETGLIALPTIVYAGQTQTDDAFLNATTSPLIVTHSNEKRANELPGDSRIDPRFSVTLTEVRWKQRN